MPLVTKAQLGVVDEVTYGTPVTVARFFELNSETIKEQRGRIESQGLRAGYRVANKDRFVPYTLGAAGDIVLEPLSKGFGWWLKHMLGTVASGAPADSATLHTGTIGDLKGDSFTCQFNRPFHPADTDQAFTYHGGKVAGWELSNDVDGLLMAKLTCDFEDMDTTTGLAVASYPSGTVENFSFVGGVVEIGDVAFDVTNAVVSCNNNLKTDRRYLRGSALKKEPVENGFRQIAWSLASDFESLTQYDRYRANTRAGALAKIELIWTAPTLIGVSAYPVLKVTIDEARFDDAPVNISGPEALTQALSGVGMYDGTTSAVTIEYTSADATP
jgi:hypothetical protein